MLAASLMALPSCGKVEPDTGGKEDPAPKTDTYASVIYRQNSEGYPIFRIPAMVTTKKGTLLCFCEGRESSNDAGNIDIVLKRSEDKGKSWSKLSVVADAGTDRYGNPVPVAMDNGDVLLIYGWSVASSASSTKVYCTVSKDDGLSWSPAVEITQQVKIKTRSKYQTGPVHGIVKQKDPHKGRIIIPVYGTSSDGTPAGIFFSDDSGATWQPGGSVDYSIGGEPTVAERGDGSLIFNMRDNDKTEPYRYQAVSEDGGDSWGPAKATPLIEPGGCQGALLTYRMGTAANNTVVLFSNPNHTSSRRHGSVKLSTDGGNTWNFMYQYTTDETSTMYSSYSDLSIVENDIIGVAYEHGLNNSLGIRFKSFHYNEIKEPYTGKDK